MVCCDVFALLMLQSFWIWVTAVGVQETDGYVLVATCVWEDAAGNMYQQDMHTQREREDGEKERRVQSVILPYSCVLVIQLAGSAGRNSHMHIPAC